MKRRGKRALAPIFMRCTATACRKRFKGHDGDRCPLCGKKATPNAEYNARPWRQQLCYCDAYEWSIRGGPHRIGSGQCKGGIQHVHECPATGADYPF